MIEILSTKRNPQSLYENKKEKVPIKTKNDHYYAPVPNYHRSRANIAEEST